MAAPADQIYEIKTHLLYELKWTIYAASRFQEERDGDPYLALIDSATIHARNLFDFAYHPSTTQFTLQSLGGRQQPSGGWWDWANNRVTHMRQRETTRAPWPSGLDNNRPDRFMVMADEALQALETGGASIPAGPVKVAFDEVVAAGRAYWTLPDDSHHNALQALYDDSRDSRPY